VNGGCTLRSSNSSYLDFAANLVYEVGRFAHVRLGARMSEVTLDEGSRQWVRLT
jgi:hypothetical protein